jgi:hypothetical protein
MGLAAMATNSQRNRDALYASLMGEIKVRASAININLRRIQDDPDAPAAFADVESCFLQIRFICELIALASLLAHEESGLNKRLMKDWNADVIFGALVKINPHCFPHPVVVAKSPNGRKSVTSPPGVFLNRSGLKKIYTECGQLLHRGRLEHASHGFKKNYDVDAMEAWLAELKKLLTDHVVLIMPERMVLIVHMFGGPAGEVEVYRAALQ